MKFFARIATAIGIAMISVAVHAQDYPNKAVKIVVTLPAGGATDAVARLIGSFLDKTWKQPVIVENRPGGGQIIGGEFVKNSPPDGYTVALFAHSLTYEDLLTKTTFNPMTDLTPMALIAGSGYVLTVPAAFPANNLKEFVAYSKANPGKVNEGTVGPTGVAEIQKLWIDLGADVTRVPYKGGALIVPALTAGEVQLYGASAPDVFQLSKAGRVRPIAYTEQVRHPMFPDVPTIAESGVGANAFDARYYFAVAGPAGTPVAVVNKMNAAIGAAVDSPEIKEKLTSFGMRAMKESPDRVRATLAGTRAGAQALIAAGILKPNF
jgi:tripartite-type tricarboxylate transporter receptor subunit TctC